MDKLASIICAVQLVEAECYKWDGNERARGGDWRGGRGKGRGGKGHAGRVVYRQRVGGNRVRGFGKKARIDDDNDGQHTLMKPPSGAARRNGGWALTLGRKSLGDRIFENSGICRFVVALPTVRLWGTGRRGDLGSFP